MALRALRLFAGLAVLLSARLASASTGVCDSNPPTTTQACIDAIQSSGGVVNDIFKDVNGRTAAQLPVFGKLVNIYPGCTTANCTQCNPGVSLAPYDCPGRAGAYTCGGTLPAAFTDVAQAVNALDRIWGHPCRLLNHTLVGACPDWTCIADGTGGSYVPWEGFVFDLGGPSNQVAIFAMNDHGPQPCESVEYTVFLTDDPSSRDVILQPSQSGADPRKWNRAVLKKIFTKGFIEIRPPDPAGHASCGDTALYSVEDDSMVTVYALPCGINFRYAAIVAGNDGLDFPTCAFDSQEAELDAVAGLTETGAAVCPDADHDGYVDCNCPGAPPVCDCDDADPNAHPGAPEACDAPKDYNCNGVRPEPCPPGKTCNAGLCLSDCLTAEFSCPVGSTCETTDAGKRVCVPDDCTVGGCPPGSVCDAQQNKCVPSCTGVTCPTGTRCIGGDCLDLCKEVTCPSGMTCIDGTCTPPCTCFAANAGCGDAGTLCDRPRDGGAPDAATGLCVPPACVGVACAAGQHCVEDGGCEDYCTGVKCPPNETCVPPPGIPKGDAGNVYGCVDLCAGVTCGPGSVCDHPTGHCKAAPGPDGGSLVQDDAGGGLVDATNQDGAADDFGAGHSSSGCSCGVVGGGEGGALFGLAAALGLTAAATRRRARPHGGTSEPMAKRAPAAFAQRQSDGAERSE